MASQEMRKTTIGMRSRRRSPLRNEFEVSPQIFGAECSTRWLSAQHFRSIIQPNYHFGLIYAMGAESLRGYAQHSYGVTLTSEEAVTFRTRFFEVYAGVAQWQQQIREALPLTESRTLSGRRRQWAAPPGIAARYNTPVQGGAADIIKRALGILPQALQGTGAVIVGTIHDEIL